MNLLCNKHSRLTGWVVLAAPDLSDDQITAQRFVLAGSSRDM